MLELKRVGDAVIITCDGIPIMAEMDGYVITIGDGDAAVLSEADLRSLKSPSHYRAIWSALADTISKFLAANRAADDGKIDPLRQAALNRLLRTYGGSMSVSKDGGVHIDVGGWKLVAQPQRSKLIDLKPGDLFKPGMLDKVYTKIRQAARSGSLDGWFVKTMNADDSDEQAHAKSKTWGSLLIGMKRRIIHIKTNEKKEPYKIGMMTYAANPTTHQPREDALFVVGIDLPGAEYVNVPYVLELGSGGVSKYSYRPATIADVPTPLLVWAYLRNKYPSHVSFDGPGGGGKHVSAWISGLLRDGGWLKNLNIEERIDAVDGQVLKSLSPLVQRLIMWYRHVEDSEYYKKSAHGTAMKAALAKAQAAPDDFEWQDTPLPTGRELENNFRSIITTSLWHSRWERAVTALTRAGVLSKTAPMIRAHEPGWYVVFTPVPHLINIPDYTDPKSVKFGSIKPHDLPKDLLKFVWQFGVTDGSTKFPAEAWLKKNPVSLGAHAVTPERLERFEKVASYVVGHYESKREREKKNEAHVFFDAAGSAVLLEHDGAVWQRQGAEALVPVRRVTMRLDEAIMKGDEFERALNDIRDLLDAYFDAAAGGEIGRERDGAVTHSAPRFGSDPITVHPKDKRIHFTIPGWQIVATRSTSVAHGDSGRAFKSLRVDDDVPAEQEMERAIDALDHGELEDWWKNINWQTINMIFARPSKLTAKNNFHAIFRVGDWKFHGTSAGAQQRVSSDFDPTRGAGYRSSEKFVVLGLHTPGSDATQTVPYVFDFNPDVPAKSRLRPARAYDLPLGFIAWAGLASYDPDTQRHHYKKMERYYVNNYKKYVDATTKRMASIFQQWLEDYYADSASDDDQRQSEEDISLGWGDRIKMKRKTHLPHPAKTEDPTSRHYDKMRPAQLLHDASKLGKWDDILAPLDGASERGRLFTGGYGIYNMRGRSASSRYTQVSGQWRHVMSGSSPAGAHFVVWGVQGHDEPMFIDTQLWKAEPARAEHFTDKLLWHIMHVLYDPQYQNDVLRGHLLDGTRVLTMQDARVIDGILSGRSRDEVFSTKKPEAGATPEQK